MEKEQQVRPAELRYRLPHVHRPLPNQKIRQMILPVDFPSLASLRTRHNNQLRRFGDLLGPLVHRHTPTRLEDTLIPDLPASLGALQRRGGRSPPAAARPGVLTEQPVSTAAGDLPSSSARPKIEERLLIASGIRSLHVQGPSAEILLLSHVTSIDARSCWSTSNKNPLRRTNHGIGYYTHLLLRHHRLPVPHFPRSGARIGGLDVPSRAKSGPYTGMHKQRGGMQQPKWHPTWCQIRRNHPVATGPKKYEPRSAFGHFFTGVFFCQAFALRFAPNRPVIDELLHQQVVAVNDRSFACAAHNCGHLVGKECQARDPIRIDHILTVQRQSIQGVGPSQMQTMPVNSPLGRIQVGRHARRGRNARVTIRKDRHCGAVHGH
mmetsp:Transcript_56737/g.130468  ORF Transcript_56737/g.130468 Transcript_56737/m.130468 type:complete len:378 (+) Transcript_56737:1187-2320(+)